MRTRLFLIAAICLGAAASPAAGQFVAPPVVHVVTPETAIVESASQVLDEIMAIPARAIPASLLCDAEGIAIVPGMLKGGFVIGVKHGRGVVVMRDEIGNWTAPFFISITGGSIGWQVGVQATDVVLVFKTKNSVRGLTNGKFTIGGDIAAAAGPVGRNAQAATDARLKAEIYSYSRSRGLFAGVSLDGAAIQTDNRATAAYYATAAGLAPPGEPQPIPASAHKLLEQVARYTAREVLVLPEPVAPAEFAPPVIEAAPLSPQQQLVESFGRLSAILDDGLPTTNVDDQWRSYLTLPAEFYAGDEQRTGSALLAVLDRFDRVAADPQYRSLTGRPQFQETRALLRQYLGADQTSPALELPPPPDQRN
jgi:lipid-binding SYLF domain-containing protein